MLLHIQNVLTPDELRTIRATLDEAALQTQRQRASDLGAAA